MSKLTFDTLRAANILRIPQYKNKHGLLVHSQDDGSDWSPAQWLQAIIGELGEYANWRKKFERGDINLSEFTLHASKELADVQTYLDILAMRCLDHAGGCDVVWVDGCEKHVEYYQTVNQPGIDLGQATIDKFNEVSTRVGADVFIVDGKISTVPF